MKRIFAVIFLLLTLSAAVFAGPVFKYEDTEELTDTVSLTTVREFYPDYNISYSYIKMDLEDERIKLKLLKSQEGADVLSTVPELAKQDKNTLGAINGDFFSVFSGKKGFSLGIEKVDGKIIQSPINPGTMATVAYDGKNVLMSYLDFHVMAVAPNWEYKEIRHINKHTSYYGDLLMYTSGFNSGFSPAPGGDVVEMVVEDNIVTEFRRGMEPCKIPENGCVLVVSEGASMFLSNNFAVGDEIKFDTYVTPSLDDFDMAFGGGSMLVYQGEDVGKIGDYTHTVSGLNPRSAIGVDKEGKTLYLVAVDGRQTSSRGMRMSHLAELLISLGCYNAVNLDGGGSTNLVASTLWNSEIHSVNRPTENRKVINAIGIVVDDGKEEALDKEAIEAEETDESSGAEEGEELIEYEENTDDDAEEQTEEITGIKIRPQKYVSFVGEPVSFEVSAHNELLRPAVFDKSELLWSSTAGKTENGVLVCDVGGRVTVNVTLGDFYVDAEVYFVDNISGIVTDDVIYMEKGESRKLPVSVFDNKGRYLDVTNLESFEFVSSNEDVITVDGNEIYAENDGTAIVTVSRGGVKSHVSVAVGSRKNDYLGDFEKESGKLYLYPADTKGGFEYSDEYALSGSLSGKISFDFTKVLPEEEASLMSEQDDESLSADDVQIPETETAEDDRPSDTDDGIPSVEENLEENSDEVIGQAHEENTDEKAEEPSEEAEQKNDEADGEQITEAAALAADDETASDDVARGVYFSLNKNVLIDKECNTVRMSVYSEEVLEHKIKAQLIDGNGKAKNLEFDGEIHSGEWSELTLTVPEKINHPVYLSKVYVLYTPGEAKDMGCVYIDDISLVTSERYTTAPAPLNSYSINTANSNVTSSVLIGAASEEDNNNPVTEYERARLEYKVSGENGILISESMKKGVSEDDYAVYVSLDTSNGGIRNTDSSQWELLMTAVESSTRQNLFLFTNSSIFGSDEFENEVISDYLASVDKEVFVVSMGDSQGFKNIKGVKFFEIDASPVTQMTLGNHGRYNALEFYFGDTVTFRFTQI